MNISLALEMQGYADIPIIISLKRQLLNANPEI